MESDKAEIENFMSNFTNARYNNFGGDRDIMRIVQMAINLKELNVLELIISWCNLFSILHLWSFEQLKILITLRGMNLLQMS